VLAGYVGVPHALGGHNQLAVWLEPSFAPPAGEAVAGAAAAEAEEEIALERTLMLVSSLIALAGIGLAVFLWLKRRDLPERFARGNPGLHRLLLNKYYVDEVYEAAVVQPIKATSQNVLWRGVDVGLVDGAVNGTASLVASSSWVLRRLQTGSVRTYAGSVIFGVVLVLSYYLWR
jgi:NADH-quinone oxidoreductase subunit L